MEAHILVMIVMIITVFHETIHSSAQDDHMNPPPPSRYSSCGDIQNISFPFQLETKPVSYEASNSYYNPFSLYCESNMTRMYSGQREEYYQVKAINYNNYTIRIVDSKVPKGNYSAFSSYSADMFGLLDTEIMYGHGGIFWSGNFNVRPLVETVVFLSCEKQVLNPRCIDTTPCINSTSAILVPHPSDDYLYAVYGTEFKFSDMAKSCTIVQTTLISSRKEKTMTTSCRQIHDELAYGIELSWISIYEKDDMESVCYVDEKSNEVHCLCGKTTARWCRIWRAIMPTINYVLGFIVYRYKNIVEVLAPRTIIGLSFVIALIIYKWRRRHLSVYDGIEEFLRSHNNLMPIRYAYSDIKKMTQSFKTKLGEGGFGSVYKGKLRSGHFVAIKMLGKSKTSGQDFINEVATIGRVHHVNVVRLVGFCFEGSKRALVYEFMPNGSLNKHIFSGEETHNSLTSEEIFDISLGIARGIEYLHRGCDMQILHFDIKPHNILLDENFTPKVSDFGLARLCPLENSIVSLTAVRGTIGYIAPELFYKNIGGVSHKADVYSFGMLLMEMASKRKTLNAEADHSSQIYFPLWIYDQFNKDQISIELEDVTEEELKTTKKMIIVALWCIQMKPCDRPPMNRVIEMLEGDIQRLEMPPKPYFYPQENYNADKPGETSRTACSSSSLDEDSTD
ncbi:Serine/threonine protein kinase [Parasponia andersonii]|uniref:Serine/threonine protein kinase n=1 Tax=Parasponia andersonii TaxID=3476 RepID=A0A2P5AQ99_PARAD|nr:Serine/threonine protein kinase [Parasponia andersonii]